MTRRDNSRTVPAAAVLAREDAYPDPPMLLADCPDDDPTPRPRDPADVDLCVALQRAVRRWVA